MQATLVQTPTQQWILNAPGQNFEITSYNKTCDQKLKKILKKQGGACWIEADEITEYDSDEFRAGIWENAYGDTHADNTAACLIRPI